MRASLLAVSTLVLVPAFLFADPTPTEPELMRSGQQALIDHDYQLATQLFTQVLEMDPQNNTAIAFLRRIRAENANQIPGKDPIAGVIITKISFQSATFSSALDFFKAEAKKQSVTVNFVSKLPATMMEQPITLNLSQIPFLDALRYLCTLNHAIYKVDTYAIEILPEPDAANAVVAPTAIPTNSPTPSPNW